MIENVTIILRWLMTIGMTAGWFWLTQYNIRLSLRFLSGHEVVFRPVPMAGLIAGFFALIACPALDPTLTEIDQIFGFSSGTHRLPLVILVIAPEFWAPLGLLGLLMGRRSMKAVSDDA